MRFKVTLPALKDGANVMLTLDSVKVPEVNETPVGRVHSKLACAVGDVVELVNVAEADPQKKGAPCVAELIVKVGAVDSGLSCLV
jgi:hypothetical protein